MQTCDQNDIINPFVDFLSHGAGFQYVTLLMFNNLLQNEQGYDARVHYVLKKLVITILRHKTKERVYRDFYYNEGGGKGGGNSEPNSNHSINMNGTTKNRIKILARCKNHSYINPPTMKIIFLLHSLTSLGGCIVLNYKTFMYSSLILLLIRLVPK